MEKKDGVPIGNPARIGYLDGIKVFLTILVVFHHAGQGYGPTGGFWYYRDGSAPWLGMFFSVNAAFFMGLFFFISGYFFPGSYDRRGGGAFLRDRVIRFGIPLLFGAFVMMPLLMYLHARTARGLSLGYFRYFVDYYLGAAGKPADWKGFWPDFNFGHLWFVEHLLVYSLLYGAYRKIAGILRPGKKGEIPVSDPAAAGIPSRPFRPVRAALEVVLFGLVLGLLTDFLRNEGGFPVDRWTALFGFIQAEPAHLPQYVSLFLLGVAAFRRNLLDKIPLRFAAAWGVVGLILAAYLWIARLGFGARIHDAWEIKESFLCIGLSLGLLALFKSRGSRRDRGIGRLAVMSPYAYGAYVLHVPVVTILQFLLDPAGFPPSLAFFLTGTGGTVLSFAAAAGLRSIPGMKQIL